MQYLAPEWKHICIAFTSHRPLFKLPHGHRAKSSTGWALAHDPVFSLEKMEWCACVGGDGNEI